jgi:hypothetical protein
VESQGVEFSTPWHAIKKISTKKIRRKKFDGNDDAQYQSSTIGLSIAIVVDDAMDWQCFLTMKKIHPVGGGHGQKRWRILSLYLFSLQCQ